MPLLQIEIVGKLGVSSRGLAQRLADACAAVLGSPPSQTWVRVQAIPRTAYAENDAKVPVGAEPVFVAITKRRLTTGPAMAREAAKLGAAVAKVTGRPRGRVHIIYEPAGAGRIAFGGSLRD